jgi:nicotinamide-nucleotide amidase
MRNSTRKEGTMKAEIITSGSELLLGEIADTNTSFLAKQLAALGIDLHFSSIVGDNFERYSGVLRQAWDRADLIITTGGLGPTQGDITREVTAALVGEEMTVRPELRQILTRFFTTRNIEMPDNNLKQAALIPSAAALPNRAGTAPGWWVEKDGRIIILMPGPPIECQDMWFQQVLPRLEKKSGAVILSRTLKTFGMSEGLVDELMTPFLSAGNPTLGIYAKADGIHLRITAKAATREEAQRLAAAREEEIRGVIGKNVWGADDETMESSIGRRLVETGRTLAVAETFTGGRLTQLFTGTPDSVRFFRGGLALPPDAAGAGEPRAEQMASRAQDFYGADFALAIDGYCVPEGDGMKTASFLTIASPDGVETRTPDFPGRPQQYVRRTLAFALSRLMNKLKTDTR